MDYRSNIDRRDCNTGGLGLSYNQVLDLTDIEPSGGLTEPVIPDEVTNFCKIDEGLATEDALLITMLITSCRLECEAITNIGFVQREIIVTQDNRNGGAFLPLGPNSDIASVKDIEGVDITYKASGTTWKQILTPYHDRLVITYTTGYSTLPGNLKLALLECIFFRYDERKVRENAHPPVYLELLNQVSRVW